MCSHHFPVSLNVFSQIHYYHQCMICVSAGISHTSVMFACVAQTDHGLSHVLLVPVDNSLFNVL